MSRINILMIVCVSMGVGCASQQEIPQVQRTRVYDATYDATWKAVIATVAERSYPIQAIEKDSGILATGLIALPRCRTKEFNDLVILPSVGLGVWRDPSCTLNLVVTSQDENKTVVQVNTSIRAFEYNMTEAWHAAYSTGSIEHTMLSAIEEHLKPK